jgi:hypothetical protein
MLCFCHRVPPDFFSMTRRGGDRRQRFPDDGDPCTSTTPPAAFKTHGFKSSLEVVSTQALTPGASTNVTALYCRSATSVSVTGNYGTASGSNLSGRVTVLVTVTGSRDGGRR